MRFQSYILAICILVLPLLGLTGCAVSLSGIGSIQGSGVVKTEKREAAGFSAIQLSGIGNVSVRQTGKESLTVRAEDNLLPHLVTKVENGTLHLHVENGKSLSPTQAIEYIVEVRNLNGLTVSGAGNVEAKDINGKRITISVSGVGNVVASGNVDVLQLNISGAGNFKGENLQTKQAKTQLSGAGNAVVQVSNELDAIVSGAGSVEYIGSPEVKSQTSGVGRVRQR